MFRTEFGTETGIVLFHGSTTDHAFVAISVQSIRRDTVIDTLSERAKEAAKQCSGMRPSIIAMQLVETSTQTLHEAIYKPSSLYDIAGAVFGGGSRRHVNSIVFTIPPALERGSLLGVAEATGPVGIIPNPNPSFPSAMADGLFTPSERSIIAAARTKSRSAPA